MSVDGTFMCLACAIGPESKSFEEVRVADYIRYYQTTGRSPPTVPQHPEDELQRKALSLPPLFKPQKITPAALTGSASTRAMLSPALASTSTTLLPSLLPNTTTTAKPRIAKPSDIPVGQEFRVHTVGGEKYHTIACMPEYEGFSSEELRCNAYLHGNKTSPVPVTMDPFVVQTKESPSSPSAISGVVALSDEKFESQCTWPEYNRHSPEELRVAFITHGRDMTSNDLLGPQVPLLTASTSTSTTPTATPMALLAPAVVPPPVIAAAPSASKFNFVFNR